MHKNAMKCKETLSKWCKNKHGTSKIMDTLETYQRYVPLKIEIFAWYLRRGIILMKGNLVSGIGMGIRNVCFVIMINNQTFVLPMQVCPFYMINYPTSFNFVSNL
jgi:uncharacterized protein involved in cysteine biosynthesis